MSTFRTVCLPKFELFRDEKHSEDSKDKEANKKKDENQAENGKGNETQITIDPKNRMELRRRQRAERAAMIRELLLSRPRDDYEDPKDVQALYDAQTTMGDFKLKTDPGYVVQEDDFVDPYMKMEQYIRLRKNIYEVKQSFNQSVFELRNQREELMADIENARQIFKAYDDELTALGEMNIKPIDEKFLTVKEIQYADRRLVVTDEELEAWRVRHEETEVNDSTATRNSPSEASSSAEMNCVNQLQVSFALHDSPGIQHGSIDRSKQLRTIGTNQIPISGLQSQLLAWRAKHLIRQKKHLKHVRDELFIVTYLISYQGLEARKQVFDGALQNLLNERRQIEFGSKIMASDLFLKFRYQNGGNSLA